MSKNTPIRILADENMPLIKEMCAALGEVCLRPGRNLSASDLEGIDALLVRSVTCVDADLLAGSQVRFVGTATIGTDHLDLAYLNQAGIQYASAPGCNADAVVDYVLSAVFTLAEQTGSDPLTKTWGVVGVGNVGGRLAERLRLLGCRVLLNDPPRAQAEPGFTQLDQLLAEADILCLHTPLARTGPHPTHHLLNAERLEQLKPGAVLLNAGRGPVIDNQALLELLQQRDDLQVVLDVWEHEPAVSRELAERCALISPHIAGYSLDGKIRGSFMVFSALAQFLRQPVQTTLQDYLPAQSTAALDATQMSPSQLMRSVYDPRVDDQLLRASLENPATQTQEFDRLRREYRIRREFAATRVEAGPQAGFCRALGFALASQRDLP
ncbi:4-phosphoerythronate dehydrogenase PdxB [Neptuniibacter sp. CAU 1671]|uniref:4-phosphoerythronate dehydrogenase PdxB n=1 Tax=Neptuniibacter sp. CAU 1671 TaxID=3032593 RepID=UPI0023DCC4CE|nr:4-phosphoerythronate dehydrogenase PdxB [Neptuniibacter sp. CAU 1671]MDF2182771.1 4-phosphoerythronate dehydrogenase PdxB [Neptuniibacter sp. CAU 1671]